MNFTAPEPRALKEARARAIEALQRLHVKVSTGAPTNIVAMRLSRRGFKRLKKESVADWFNRYAERNAPREKFAPREFTELKPERHLREDEIDALPRQIGMGSTAHAAWWES